MKTLNKKRLSGQSLTEFLIASTATTVVLLYGASILGEFGIARLQTVSGARLAAWQRTAWLPSHVMSADELTGVEGATAKNDTEMTRDIVRHSFLDTSYNNPSLHAADNSEFSSVAMKSSKKEVTVATTISKGPDLLGYKDKLLNAWSSARAAIGGDTGSNNELIGKFTFWGNGYLKNEVKVKTNVSNVLRYIELWNKGDEVKDYMEIVEQVTLLTEPWNAGGTLRETAKIQGLVPLKATDSKFNKDNRGTFEKALNNAVYLLPKINKDAFTFGFVPGGAPDVAPLDRHEQEKGIIEVEKGTYGPPAYGPKPGYFRPYRAFPPTPPITVVY